MVDPRLVQLARERGVTIAPDGTLSKTDFATFTIKSPGLISQWCNGNPAKKQAPKIVHGLRGTGRSARIHVETALAELGDNLNLGQQQWRDNSPLQLLNGDEKQVQAPVPAADTPEKQPGLIGEKQQLDLRVAHNRLLREEIALARERGTVVDVVEMQEAIARLMGQVVQQLERSTGEIAEAISVGLGTDPRLTRQIVKEAIANWRNRTSEVWEKEGLRAIEAGEGGEGNAG